jgi:protein SCO1
MDRTARPLVIIGAFVSSLLVGLFLVLWLMGGFRHVTAPAAVGGPFQLTDQTGQAVTEKSMQGRPTLIFFGFTHCPDVCPTTLARMTKLRNELGAGQTPFEILFVTVDPERDGPAEVGKYAELFNSPIVGLTGSPAEIEKVKSEFGIFSKKVPDGSGGYSVDHSATVLLFDRNGQFAATIAPEEGDGPALAKLKRITA